MMDELGGGGGGEVWAGVRERRAAVWPKVRLLLVLLGLPFIQHMDGGIAVLPFRDIIHLIRLIRPLQALHLLLVLPAVPAPKINGLVGGGRDNGAQLGECFLGYVLLIIGQSGAVGELEGLKAWVVHTQLLHTLLPVPPRAAKLGHVLAVQAVPAGHCGLAPGTLSAVVFGPHPAVGLRKLLLQHLAHEFHLVIVSAGLAIRCGAGGT